MQARNSKSSESEAFFDNDDALMSDPRELNIDQSPTYFKSQMEVKRGTGHQGFDSETRKSNQSDLENSEDNPSIILERQSD